MNLSLKFRESFVGDLWAVGEELDQLVAAINARVPLRADGSIGLLGDPLEGKTTIDSLVTTRGATLAGTTQLNGPLEVLRGPLFVDAVGRDIAMIQPPQTSGTYNDYAPPGLDTAWGMEIEPSGATVLTGLSNPTRRKRLLLFRNRDSGFSVTLNHEDSNSVTSNRFDLNGGSNIVVPERSGVILYYDPDRGASPTGRWTILAQ